MSSDNPIVANIIYSHSVKMAKANRESATGALEERHARIKQTIDNVSRYARYGLGLTRFDGHLGGGALPRKRT
jgi:hypothetical protein